MADAVRESVSPETVAQKRIVVAMPAFKTAAPCVVTARRAPMACSVATAPAKRETVVILQTAIHALV